MGSYSSRNFATSFAATSIKFFIFICVYLFGGSMILATAVSIAYSLVVSLHALTPPATEEAVPTDFILAVLATLYTAITADLAAIAYLAWPGDLGNVEKWQMTITIMPGPFAMVFFNCAIGKIYELAVIQQRNYFRVMVDVASRSLVCWIGIGFLSLL